MNDVTRIDCAGCPVGGSADRTDAGTDRIDAETGPDLRGRVIGGRPHSCGECVVSLLLDVPTGPSGLAPAEGASETVRRAAAWPAERAAAGVIDVEIGPRSGRQCDTGHVVGIRTRNCQ